MFLNFFFLYFHFFLTILIYLIYNFLLSRRIIEQHSKHRTGYNIVHTVLCSLYSVHSIIITVHSELISTKVFVHLTENTIQQPHSMVNYCLPITLLNIQCIQYSIHSTWQIHVCTLLCSLYSVYRLPVQNSQYIPQLCLRSTLFIIQCIEYSIQSAWNIYVSKLICSLNSVYSIVFT